MKKSYLLCIFLLLSACTPLSKREVDKQVNEILSNRSMRIPLANRSKQFYRYFLANDMHLEETSETGAIINKGGYRIVMNFNTSNLIINEYYSDLSEENETKDVVFKQYTEESLQTLAKDQLLVPKEKEIASIEKKPSKESKRSDVDERIIKKTKNGIVTYRGYYKSAMHDALYLQLKLKRVNDDYYIHLDGTIVSFSSVVPAEEVDNIVHAMMVIMKSIRYEKEEILDMYSLKHDLKAMEEKFKENNDFVYQNLPSQGYLEDLIRGNE
ncbi:MAG: hypothetical protein EOM50_18990 [Erysipelotrichia bacterium]|nr:hypothetical protein [Erysipelotrichia bacterium]NCC54479.1 hypothetical protein [Erysipelotrichia bacterium]